MSEPRGFYRSYQSTRTCRLHVMRETGKWAGRQGWCGTNAGDVTDSVAVIVQPLPAVPPDGLTWCGGCVGRLAREAMP